MDILQAIKNINDVIAIPATCIFVGVGVFLTFKTKFLQLRAGGRFLRLLKPDPKEEQYRDIKRGTAINPMHAMFTAMATTIGMGNIIGPSVAIIAGGPGALFWLVAYAFLGAITKYTEVTFAVHTRKTLEDGTIIGGPTQYLSVIHPFIARWYGVIMMVVFSGWSANQSNALAKTFEQEGVPALATGIVLALFTFFILIGGVKRVGLLASKLVPFMFVLYVSFSLFIIFKDVSTLMHVLGMVFKSAFGLHAAASGLAGYSVFYALNWGTTQSIYITEAGLGTASIAHAKAHTERPSDQGVLAMYSIVAEVFLSLLSGLLVLVTGVWLTAQSHQVNTLMYEVFKSTSPCFGKYILVTCITLFVITTVIGNSFNGGETFGSFTRHRWVNWYYVYVTCLIVFGSVASSLLVWELMRLFVVLVAVPNLLALLILAFRYPKVID